MGFGSELENSYTPEYEMEVVSEPTAGNVAAAPVNNMNSYTLAATGYMGQDVGLCDLISSKFDSVISCIDEEIFSGEERDLSM